MVRAGSAKYSSLRRTRMLLRGKLRSQTRRYRLYMPRISCGVGGGGGRVSLRGVGREGEG